MRNDVLLVAGIVEHHGELPSIAKTRGGVMFSPRQDRWAYREGVKTISLDFNAILARSPQMAEPFKKTLLWYAENKSPSHLQAMHTHFMLLHQHLYTTRQRAIDQITDVDVLNYKASLPVDRSWYLGTLSGFLKKWHQLGIPGVSDSAVGLLKELRLKGNPHGVAIKTMDPLIGPFTSLEQEALQSSVNDAFALGTLDEDMYFLAWLLMSHGARPSQYAALKVCDLIKGTFKNGAETFTLKIPRAKQRGDGPRAQFKDRPLIRQIGAPLYEYAQRVRSAFVGILDDPDSAPLFPAARQGGRVAATPEYAYHDTSRGIAVRLCTALSALGTVSERMGGAPLNITFVRFRRTFGTRAAQEGYGALVIAELLDHTDTQHVGVYVASVPEIAERIDRAVAMHLAPLAQAFAGILISGDAEATRSGDPTSRILDYRTDQSKPMGSCGQHSVCSFNAPIACYTCRNFEPWLDGPHEALLARLLAERERLSATTDKRIASVNDRTILAVAQVVQLCAAVKEQGGLDRG
jgi:integrase